MRKLVAGVAAALAAPLFLFASGTEASADQQNYPVYPPGYPQCAPSQYLLFNGEGVSMTCGYGPTPYYRVVARCVSGLTEWTAYGNLASTGFGPSSAECRGVLLGSARMIDYHVDWS
ncbi:hypothetical protein F0L68_19350 [Solihabitans fulvus]|uniref:Uncharacterized protein n=1 Tax=Solihabitans fulvus TaxID=1892852 RepID=A0A5B2XCW4_9PSEU|nr:hypothetical protein [Solihabitans fulvus]KAA2260955.1 hypothetical protein F0L68_19350 [Solihabitans fulvus]